VSRAATARAAAPAGRAQTARRAAAAAPARRSAPPRRPAAPARRRPVRRAAARPSGEPTLVQRVGIAARARAGRAVDSALHGHGLIAVVFLLLVGVVFANVALLQKNRQVTRDAARVSELKRDNATLRAEVATLGSSERIQQVAAERGLLLPAPDQVRYLRSNPRVDAVAAAKQVDEGAAALAATGYDTASTGYVDPAPAATDSSATYTDPTAGYVDPAATAGTPLASAGDPASAVP